MSKVRIEVSARHAHLTQQDLERLFGEGYKLKPIKDLSQHGQFASQETITLVGPKRSIEDVRVLGPCRQNTQVEISMTDSYFLGAKAPVRLSGKIIGSGAITLKGPVGEVELKEGLIVAKRHLHINPEQAQEYGVTDGQNIKVAIDGPRALVFDEIQVRIHDDFDLSLHIDTDEANAAGVNKETEGELIV